MSKERNFKEIVEKVVGDINQKLSKNKDRIEKAWIKEVGPNIDRHTKVKEFKEGIIYIITDNPAWIHEVKRIKKELILKLKNNTKEEVKDIKTRLGDIK
jgi:predicted nucleic acid-binding Zn ribbon protein